MRVLFVGDIVGRPGRRAVERWLPSLRDDLRIDVTVANAENAAGGLGATPEVLDELRACGVAAFTMGNHTWRKSVLLKTIDGMVDIARPANYSPGVPGRGSVVVRLPDGRKLGLVNVIGRVFMTPVNCPFEYAAREVDRLREETPFVLVDMHAEATSEKVAMGWHLDGRCSAVLGTHTHVPTADERVFPQGTAYITDVGMTGPCDGIIGTERDAVLMKFLTGLPKEFTVAKGPVWLNAVMIELDDVTGRARAIKRVMRRES